MEGGQCTRVVVLVLKEKRSKEREGERERTWVSTLHQERERDNTMSSNKTVAWAELLVGQRGLAIDTREKREGEWEVGGVGVWLERRTNRWEKMTV